MNQLAEEQFGLLKQFVDAFVNTVRRVVDVLKQMWNMINERWDKFKEMVADVDELIYSDHTHHWATPMKMVRTSQVLSRKPVMLRARSNC